MATENRILELDEIEEYILLLVNVDAQPIQGRQKLQVLMYMLGDPYEEIREMCNFTINDNGPYSTVLDDSLDHLVQTGMLAESDDAIQLTEKSVAYAKEIVDKKDKILKFPGMFNITMPDVFIEHKSGINDITVPEMLSFMYCLYPDMRKGSATYEKIKPDIKEHLFSLLAKEKLSLARFAGFLDMPIHLAMKEAGKRGLLRLDL